MHFWFSAVHLHKLLVTHTVKYLFNILHVTSRNYTFISLRKCDKSQTLNFSDFIVHSETGMKITVWKWKRSLKSNYYNFTYHVCLNTFNFQPITFISFSMQSHHFGEWLNQSQLLSNIQMVLTFLVLMFWYLEYMSGDGKEPSSWIFFVHSAIFCCNKFCLDAIFSRSLASSSIFSRASFSRNFHSSCSACSSFCYMS